ncbi:MAG: hypothetical protein U1E05_20320, partial [Patescibacteria group bacterium]|nr:hypothetical protein [Patescibacteria group bacterium]
MTEPFDPYRHWLGVEEPKRPLDHYQLLGLPRFESDPKQIAHAADTAMTKVRMIRPGEHIADWGRLLDQLGVVKACLLDPSAKAAYDASLRSGPVPSPPPATHVPVAETAP